MPNHCSKLYPPKEKMLRIVFVHFLGQIEKKIMRLKPTLILKRIPTYRAQIRKQMSGPDLHVFTLKFLALKKLVFPHKNTFQKFFDFYLPLFYAKKKVKAVSTSEHLFTFGKTKERKSRKCCVISGRKNSKKFLKNSSTDNV